MKWIRLIGNTLLLAIAAYAAFAGEIHAAASDTTDSPALLSPVLILESDFEPDDWIATAEATGGATYTVSQQLTGGFGTPTFRLITHRLPPADSSLVFIGVTHIYQDATYDPRSQGPITKLDYSESGIILSFPFDEAFITSQPVVVQGGRVYRAREFLRFIATNSSHGWETKSLTDLVATDFVAVDGNEDDHPDFSSNGGPIQFGFIRLSSRSSTLPPVPAGEDMVLDHGIDNFQWIVYRESGEPANRPPQAQDDIFILDGNIRNLPLLGVFTVTSNDSDPDRDILEVVEVTQPTYGSAEPFGFHSIGYLLEEARTYDTFGYTISDGELTSSATVEMFLDCACTVLCLSTLELPEVASGQITETIDLPLIYRVRDQVMKPTVDGRRYIEMYYHSNPEILANIVTNEDLRNEALSTIELWQEPLRSLTDGDGSAIITQEQVDALQSLLSNLSAASGSTLQLVIATELQRLGPLDEYVGMSVKEAKRKAIGDPSLHLPLVNSHP